MKGLKLFAKAVTLVFVLTAVATYLESYRQNSVALY